jgi:hypothetical protein
MERISQQTHRREFAASSPDRQACLALSRGDGCRAKAAHQRRDTHKTACDTLMRADCTKTAPGTDQAHRDNLRVQVVVTLV